VARSFLTQDGSVAVVLIPLPAQDSTPRRWRSAGRCSRRSARGQVRHTRCDTGEGDALMVTGQGLDPWSRPRLARFVGIGRLLAADGAPVPPMTSWFRRPPSSILSLDDVRLDTFDGLLLPAPPGTRHAPLSRERRAPRTGRRRLHRRAPVGAICHVCCSRSQHEPGDRSIRPLGKQTTALTWSLEQRAWRVGRLTRFWDPGYYRTYEEEAGQPAGYMSVEQEVTRALERPEDFLDVVPGTPDAQ